MCRRILFCFAREPVVRAQPVQFAVALKSDDGVTSMSVRGRRTDRLPADSVFGSLEEASAFFRAGELGYSATPDPARFQGMRLRCHTWQVEPLQVEEVHSSFFEVIEKITHGLPDLMLGGGGVDATMRPRNEAALGRAI